MRNRHIYGLAREPSPYTASEELTAFSGDPSCGQEYIPTGETANTVYGTLPNGSHGSLTQTFGTVITPAYAPDGPYRRLSTIQRQYYRRLHHRPGWSVSDVFRRRNRPLECHNRLGPTGLARQGAALAASQHFGIANQTDVFLIDQNSQLEYFWVDGLTGAINGPQIIQQQQKG